MEDHSVTNMKRTFYCKRNPVKGVIFMQSSENPLRVGDKFEFNGVIYSDRACKKPVATANIFYEVGMITQDGVVLETVHKYKFSDDGSLNLKGTILSPDFRLKNRTIAPYVTVPANLCVKSGTKDFKNAFGSVKYTVIGPGSGTLNFDINLLKEAN
jgi:hypothetical protein